MNTVISKNIRCLKKRHSAHYTDGKDKNVNPTIKWIMDFLCLLLAFLGFGLSIVVYMCWLPPNASFLISVVTMLVSFLIPIFVFSIILTVILHYLPVKTSEAIRAVMYQNIRTKGNAS